MSAADYVATFVSIVLGLALADLATSLHKLLRAGRRVKWDYLAPLAALGTVLAVVAGWWELYDAFPGKVSMSTFLPFLVSLMLLFLLAAAALPDEVPAEGIDLRAYYLGHRTYFWGLFTLFLLSTVIADILSPTSPGWRTVLFEARWKLPFVPTAGLLMWTRQPLAHAAALFAMLAVGAIRLNSAVGIVG